MAPQVPSQRDTAVAPAATPRWRLRLLYDGLPILVATALAVLLLCFGVVPNGTYTKEDDDDDVEGHSDDIRSAMIYTSLVDMCDQVNPELSQAWLQPFASVTFACFVPPLYLLVQLMRKFDLIGTCTSRAHAMIDGASGAARGQLEVQGNATTSTIQQTENPMLKSAIDEGKTKVIEMINTGADKAHETVDDVADQANEALEQAEEAVAPFDTQCVEVFFLIVNTGISFWALFGYLSSDLRPQGDGICMAAYITAAVQYKPFALSMFAVVVALGDGVYWTYVESMPAATRKILQIPHDSKQSPLDINFLTLSLLWVVAVPLLVWFSAAFIFITGLGIMYFPIPLVTLVLLPLLFQYFPIYLLEKVEGWLDSTTKDEADRSPSSNDVTTVPKSDQGVEGAEETKAEEGLAGPGANRRDSVAMGLDPPEGTADQTEREVTIVPQALLLKVVASQVFCTAVALAALGSTYQGNLSWVEGLQEVVGLLRALSIDLSFDLGFTFAWPDLMPDFAKIQLALALGSIGLQNVQKVFNYIYFKYVKLLGCERILGAVDHMLNAEHAHGGGGGSVTTDALLFLPFNVLNGIALAPAKAILFVKSLRQAARQVKKYAYQAESIKPHPITNARMDSSILPLEVEIDKIRVEIDKKTKEFREEEHQLNAKIKDYEAQVGSKMEIVAAQDPTASRDDMRAAKFLAADLRMHALLGKSLHIAELDLTGGSKQREVVEGLVFGGTATATQEMLATLAPKLFSTYLRRFAVAFTSAEVEQAPEPTMDALIVQSIKTLDKSKLEQFSVSFPSDTSVSVGGSLGELPNMLPSAKVVEITNTRGISLETLGEFAAEHAGWVGERTFRYIVDGPCFEGESLPHAVLNVLMSEKNKWCFFDHRCGPIILPAPATSVSDAHVTNIRVVDLDVKASFKVSGNLEYFSVLVNLVSLNMSGCEDIEGDISALANKQIEILNLSNCNKLIGNIKDLPQSITDLNLSSCTNLKGNLESLPKSVTNLNLAGTNIEGNIKDLPQSITDLNLQSCTKLEGNIKDLPQSITDLILYGCGKLEGDIESLKDCPLQTLNLFDCSKLTGNIESLKDMPLTSCNLYYCKNLTGDIESLKDMPLTSCNLYYCKKLSGNIKDLPQSITDLNLAGCENLEGNIKDLPQSITDLNLFGCKRLEGNIKDLPQSITDLNLQFCTELEGKGQAKAMFPNAKVTV